MAEATIAKNPLDYDNVERICPRCGSGWPHCSDTDPRTGLRWPHGETCARYWYGDLCATCEDAEEADRG